MGFSLVYLAPLSSFIGLPVQMGISFSVTSTTIPTIRCSTNLIARPIANYEPSITSMNPVARRTANYEPSIWKYDYVQSISSKYVGKHYQSKANKLREAVQVMLEKVQKPFDTIHLVDTLQRLGISYHFEDIISRIIDIIYKSYYKSSNSELDDLDLLTRSMHFRILRQHGYHLPQEIFNNFMDKSRHFKKCICDDIDGILNLYEASYLSVDGERIMDEAKNFTTKNLQYFLKTNNSDETIHVLVSHALEVPLHWRVPRLEARWFIDFYERCHDMNPLLLELAKLDYNMVQAVHQEDLKYASRYTCLPLYPHVVEQYSWAEKLSFARDRLMENFLWTIGVNFKPTYGHFRITSTKVNSLITTIDDIFDVYGTLEELEQFTNQTIRWDIDTIRNLPDYMQICFLGFYNTVNETIYETLTDKGILNTPYINKAWTDLCKAYLLEAKWYSSGHKLSLEEYMDNAWISISAPVILTHAYFLTTNDFTEDTLQSLDTYPSVICYAAIILRLADDLGTSNHELERGGTPKSLQCYMYESGVSEEEAREHIKNMISETWKKMNKEQLQNSQFSPEFIEVSMNLARMALCMYLHGDGHASQDPLSKARVLSLLIDPIQGV